MDISGFFTWLATSTGASVVVSFILERIPKFQDLASEAKKWVFFGACSLLAVGSYCVLTFVPADVLSAIAPFFGLIASIFTSVFVGESFHKLDKQPATWK